MSSETPLPEWIKELKRIQTEIRRERDAAIARIRETVKEEISEILEEEEEKHDQPNKL